jgi:diketogulonate reductase-like aldo/keto reductase
VETVNLSRSGLKVSRLCLGTMIFGAQVAEEAAFAILDKALELSIDFLDTADSYPAPPSVAVPRRSWGAGCRAVARLWLSRRSAASPWARARATSVGAAST